MLSSYPFTYGALLAFITLAASVLAVPCPPGTFSTGSTCEKCQPGTYQNESGQNSCKKCPAGTFTQFAGVTAEGLCLKCPAEYNSLPGSSSCFKCPTGEIRICENCIHCPPGTRISGCECRPCSPGFFSTEANLFQCTQCPPLQRATEDRTGCRDAECPLGEEFDFGCSVCRELSFRNASMTKCEPCPRRTTFLDYSKPKVRCMKCPPGQFITDIFTSNTEDGEPVCLPCPPGRTTVGFGKAFCRREGGPCPSNFFEDDDGDCDRCDKHQRFIPGQKKCVDCAPNEFSRGGLVTKCDKCPPGHLFSGFQCECPPGLFSRKGKCRPCPAGTYKRGFSLGDCVGCLRDSFSERGASKCTMCPPGTSSQKSNGRKCERLPTCPEGFVLPPKLRSVFSEFICISGTSGCPKGLVGAGYRRGRFLCKNKKGEVVCPRGQIFNNVDACISCTIGWKLTEKPSGELKCSPCDDISISKGGLTRECRKCKGNLLPSKSEQKCVCPYPIPGNRKKCIPSNRCPSGTIPVTNPLGRVSCVKCLPGTFQSGENCVNCPVNKTSNLGATGCADCPPGTGTYDAGGELLNRPIGDANCVPI